MKTILAVLLTATLATGYADKPQPAPAPAANTGTITGQAMERDGTPAMEAIIHVRSDRGQAIGGGYTASNGTFAVAVPAGSNIWVQIQGKLAGRRTGVTVKAGEKTDVGTIKLTEMRQ